MLYRVRIDLAFTEQKHARKAMESPLAMLPNARTINPDTMPQERGSIILQECNHDETPEGSCANIEEHYTS